LVCQKGKQNLYLLNKSEDAYGNRDESLIFEVEKSFFPEDFNIRIGEPVQLRMMDGGYTFAIIKDIQNETIILDANHPLAGVDINFDITIVGINEISEEEFNNIFNNSYSCEDEECDCDNNCSC